MLQKVYSVTMTSGATLTGALDLKGVYDKVYLEIPTFASGGTLYVRGSSDNSTFRQIYNPQNSSGVVSVFQMAQGGNQIVPLPAQFQYYKIELTTGVTNATTTFKFICSREN